MEKNIGFSITVDGVGKDQQELAKLEVAMKSLRKEKLKLQKESLKEGKVTDANAKKLANLTTQINKNKASQKQLKQAITPTESSFVRLGKTLLASAGLFLGLTTVIRGVFNVIKNGFKTSWEFEYAMSQVKAITKATTKDFNALRTSAISLGGSTKFTATEVAGLQKEYAKLGFTTTEILRITKATLDLAAATGSDLATSATVAGATLRQFQLDATQMGHVVDVMAASFSTSALDMSKWETAMSKAGPVAKAVGETIESTAAKLAILSDNGLDASISGTSLRNIFLELEKRGLTWDQAMNKIQGSQNKASTSLELFGKRGAVAGLILAGNNTTLEEMNESLKDVDGSAKEMAETMLDNVQGSMTILKSAWEGLTLRINESDAAINNFVKNLTLMVQGIATKGIKNLDELFDDKKINSFNERFRFFIAMGVGYQKAAKMARKNTNEDTQKLKDEFVQIGKEHEAAMKVITDAKLKIDADKKKANDDELKRLNAAVEMEAKLKEIKDEVYLSNLEEEAKELERLKISHEKELEEWVNNEQVKTALTEQYNAERFAIHKKYKLKQEALDAKELIKLKEDNQGLQGATTEQFYIDDLNKLKEYNGLTIDEIRVKNEILTAEEEDKEKNILDLKVAGIEGAQAGADAVFNAKKSRLQAEMEAELSNQNLSEQQKLIIKKKYAKEQQKIDVKQATINGLLAIGKTWAQLGFPAAIIPSLLIAAQTAAEIITIKAQKFAKGGKISSGVPVNTGTKDDTLIAVNKTETVLTKDHVNKLGGSGVMRDIGVPGYAGGGYTGQSAPSVQASGFNVKEMAALINSLEIRLDINKVNSAQRELEVITQPQPL